MHLNEKREARYSRLAEVRSDADLDSEAGGVAAGGGLKGGREVATQGMRTSARLRGGIK